MTTYQIDLINERESLIEHINHINSLISAYTCDAEKGYTKAIVDELIDLNIEVCYLASCIPVIERRLARVNIYVQDNQYFEKIHTEFTNDLVEVRIPTLGNEYDKDSETIKADDNLMSSVDYSPNTNITSDGK